MINKLIFLALCLGAFGNEAEAITYGGRELQADFLTNIKTSRNFIKNYGAEQNVNNVTGTNVTVTRNTTTPLEGVGDFSFTIDSATDVVAWSTNTLDKKLSGQNCEAKISYTADANASNVKLGVYSGANLVSSVALVNASTARVAQVNFPCGDLSAALTLKIFGNAATSTVMKVDAVYLSEATNVGTSAQAVLVGGAVVTGCSASWNTSSTSFTTSLGTPTGCSYATFGAAQAPATNIAGIKFSSLPPGDYMIQYEGTIYANGGVGFFQFTDGTNITRENSQIWANGSPLQTNGINQSFTYTTAQSNVTWQSYLKTSSAGAPVSVYGTTANPGTFKLWYFPSSAQQAVKVDQAPSSWSGYHNGWTGNSATCHTGNSTYSDVSACTGITLNQTTNRNFGTVTTAASSLPGIIITPNKTGMYQICASGSLYNSTALTASVRMVDGSGTIINPGASVYLASNSTMPALCGIYNATAATATTIKLQLAASPGNAAFWVGQASGSGLNWTITALDQGMAVPYLVQSVVASNSSFVTKEEYGCAGSTTACTAACTTGTCGVGKNSDPGLSVTWISTGVYRINFPAGVFASEPICIPSSTNLNNVCQSDNKNNPGSATTAYVSCATSNTGAKANEVFYFDCKGQ